MQDLTTVKTKDLLNELASRPGIREIVDSLVLHINKIGEYNTETVRKALKEDLNQFQNFFR